MCCTLLKCLVLKSWIFLALGNCVCVCLENSVDRGAWWAAVHGVAQSQTRLKRLSMRACIGEGNSNPLQYSFLENLRDRRTWWAAIYGIAQSRTRLKRLSSSSSILYLVKNCLPMQETEQTWIQSLSWEDPLEKGIAALFSILSWRIPWTEEPGGLQSMGSHRV